jgi:hypothetical protein
MAVKQLMTKAEYKAYAGIASANQDTEIDNLIPKVSQLIKSYCRRSFTDYAADAKVESFNGGTKKYYLKEYPLLTMLSVEYSTDYGQNYNALEEYVDFVADIEDSSIISLDPKGFPYAINGYTITYTAGYDTVPEDLKLAAMDLITYYRKNDASVHNNRTPGGGGSVQLEYIMNTNFPAHIKRVLDQYTADYA